MLWKGKALRWLNDGQKSMKEFSIMEKRMQRFIRCFLMAVLLLPVGVRAEKAGDEVFVTAGVFDSYDNTFVRDEYGVAQNEMTHEKGGELWVSVAGSDYVPAASVNPKVKAGVMLEFKVKLAKDAKGDRGEMLDFGIKSEWWGVAEWRVNGVVQKDAGTSMGVRVEKGKDLHVGVRFARKQFLLHVNYYNTKREEKHLVAQEEGKPGDVKLSNGGTYAYGRSSVLTVRSVTAFDLTDVSINGESQGKKRAKSTLFTYRMAEGDLWLDASLSRATEHRRYIITKTLGDGSWKRFQVNTVPLDGESRYPLQGVTKAEENGKKFRPYGIRPSDLCQAGDEFLILAEPKAGSRLAAILLDGAMVDERSFRLSQNEPRTVVGVFVKEKHQQVLIVSEIGEGARVVVKRGGEELKQGDYLVPGDRLRVLVTDGAKAKSLRVNRQDFVPGDEFLVPDHGDVLVEFISNEKNKLNIALFDPPILQWSVKGSGRVEVRDAKEKDRVYKNGEMLFAGDVAASGIVAAQVSEKVSIRLVADAGWNVAGFEVNGKRIEVANPGELQKTNEYFLPVRAEMTDVYVKAIFVREDSKPALVVHAEGKGYLTVMDMHTGRMVEEGETLKVGQQLRVRAKGSKGAETAVERIEINGKEQKIGAASGRKLADVSVDYEVQKEDAARSEFVVGAEFSVLQAPAPVVHIERGEGVEASIIVDVCGDGQGNPGKVYPIKDGDSFRNEAGSSFLLGVPKDPAKLTQNPSDYAWVVYPPESNDPSYEVTVANGGEGLGLKRATASEVKGSAYWGKVDRSKDLDIYVRRVDKGFVPLASKQYLDGAERKVAERLVVKYDQTREVDWGVAMPKVPKGAQLVYRVEEGLCTAMGVDASLESIIINGQIVAGAAGKSLWMGYSGAWKVPADAESVEIVGVWRTKRKRVVTYGVRGEGRLSVYGADGTELKQGAELGQEVSELKLKVEYSSVGGQFVGVLVNGRAVPVGSLKDGEEISVGVPKVGSVFIEAVIGKKAEQTLYVSVAGEPWPVGDVEVLRDGERLQSGDAVKPGDRLVITAQPAAGKRLVQLKVNGELLGNGNYYVVPADGCNVEVEAVMAEQNSYVLVVDQQGEGEVMVERMLRGGTQVERLQHGTEVKAQDRLRVTARGVAGKSQLRALFFNQQVQLQAEEGKGVSCEVGEGNFYVKAQFCDRVSKVKHRLCILVPTGGEVRVFDATGRELKDGDALDELVARREALTISSYPFPSNQRGVLQVNGLPHESGALYELGAELAGDLVVRAGFLRAHKSQLVVEVENSQLGGELEVRDEGGHMLSDGALLQEGQLLRVRVVSQGKAAELPAVTVSGAVTKRVGTSDTWVVGTGIVYVRVAFAEGYYRVNYNSGAPAPGVKVEGIMDAQKVPVGVMEKLSRNQYSAEGYRFDEWRTDKGESYRDEQAVRDIAVVGSSVALIAQWKKVFPVTFDLAGGLLRTLEENPQKVDEGEMLNLEALEYIPEKPGFIFRGWYSDAQYSGLVSKLQVTEAKSVYAKWELEDKNVKVYKVGFDFDGGSLAGGETSAEVEVLAEEAARELRPAPTKEGHRLVEWQVESTPGTWESYDFSRPVTGDIKLRAKWKKVYIVRFDANGGVLEGGLQRIDSDGYAEQPNVWREGWLLRYWADGSGAPFDFRTKIGADKTLVAEWGPCVYFDTDEGLKVTTAVGEELASGEAVEVGTQVRVAIQGKPGKRIKQLLVDGKEHSGGDYVRELQGEAVLKINKPTTIKVVYGEVYEIAVAQDENRGTVKPGLKEAFAGDIVQLTVTPKSGYKLASVSYNEAVSGRKVELDLSNSSFTMPSYAVKLEVKFEVDKNRKFTVNTETEGQGKVSVSLKEANVEEKIEVTADAESGWEVKEISYSFGGKSVALGNKRAFEMPGSDVIVKAVFNEVASTNTVRVYVGEATSPVSGAKVIITDGSSHEYDGITGNDGNADIGGVPALTGTITVENPKDPAEKVTVPVTVGNDGRISPNEVNLSSRIEVTVKVIDVDNSGVGVAEAAVVVGAQRVNTNGQGEAILGLIEGGKYSIVATHSKYNAEGCTLKLTAAKTSAGDDNTIELHRYKVTVDGGVSHGVVKLDRSGQLVGSQVELTIEPQPGYKLKKLDYRYSEGTNESCVDLTAGVSAGKVLFPMPAADVRVTAEFEEDPEYEFSITCEASAGGKVTSDKDKAKWQETIALTVEADQGYKLDVLECVDGTGSKVQIDGNGSFTMPRSSVTVKATFTEDSESKFKVEVKPAEHGTVRASATEVAHGGTVEVFVYPDASYKLKTLTYTLAALPSGKSRIDVAAAPTNLNKNVVRGTFVMPKGDVIVEAEFEEDPEWLYRVYVAKSMKYGTVNVAPISALAQGAKAGAEIKLEPYPVEGYEVDKITYSIAGSSDAYEVHNRKFTMPKGDVTVRATFKPAAVTFRYCGGASGGGHGDYEISFRRQSDDTEVKEFDKVEVGESLIVRCKMLNLGHIVSGIYYEDATGERFYTELISVGNGIREGLYKLSSPDAYCYLVETLKSDNYIAIGVTDGGNNLQGPIRVEIDNANGVSWEAEEEGGNDTWRKLVKFHNLQSIGEGGSITVTANGKTVTVPFSIDREGKPHPSSVDVSQSVEIPVRVENAKTGAPIAGATVTVGRQRVLTNGDGVAKPQLINGGSYSFYVTAKSYEDYRDVWAEPRWKGTTVVLKMNREHRAVTFQVVDEKGAPRGAVVKLMDDEGVEHSADAGKSEKGVYVFSDVPAPIGGTVSAEVEDANGEKRTVSVPVTIDEEGVIQPPVLRIADCRKVKVKVIDKGDKHPIGDARLFLGAQECVTNNLGEADLWVFPHCKYRYKAKAARYAVQHGDIDIDENKADPNVIELDWNAVRIKVVRGSGPVAGASVAIFSESGSGVSDGLTNKEEGVAALRGVPEVKGGYVKVTTQTEGQIVVPVTVDSEGNANPSVIDLSQPMLRFVVKDTEGKEQQNAKVTVSGVTFETDAKGRAAFAGLEVGSQYGYEVRFGGDVIKREVKLPKGGITVVVTLGRKDDVKATFNAAGGRFVDGSEVYEVWVPKNGTLSELDDKPKRDGYQFKEWQLNGTKYKFGAQLTKEVTLDAKWSGNEVSVTVVNGKDAVTGAKVIIMDDEGAVHEGFTNLQGEAKVGEVPVVRGGTVTVMGEVDGKQRTVTLPIRVDGEGKADPDRVDLSQIVEVAVQVYDAESGHPIPNAKVSIGVQQVSADGNGVVRLSVQGGKEYKNVKVEAGGYITKERVELKVENDGKVSPPIILLERRKSVLSFVVLDEEGKPLDGVQVTVEDWDGAFEKKTDGQGVAEFSLRFQDGSSRDYTLIKDGYKEVEGRVTMQENGARIEVRMMKNVGTATATCKVTFKAVGGRFKDGAEEFIKYVVKGSTIKEAEVETPTKVLQEFVEWQSGSKDPRTKWEFSNKIDKDKILYAKWKDAKVPALRFLVQDGQGRALEKAIVKADGREIETDSEGLATFLGQEAGKTYSYRVSCDGYEEAQGSVEMVVGGMTVVVRLQQKGGSELPKQVTVTFDAAGGMFKDGNGRLVVSVEQGKQAAAPNDAPEKAGYTFAGWYYGDAKYEFKQEVTGDIALMASWTPDGTMPTFTVTFDADGGKPAPRGQSLNEGDRASRPVPGPKKEGYTFKGWYLPDDTEYDFGNEVNADITLTAKWEANDVYLHVFVVDQDLKPVKGVTVKVPNFDDKVTEESGCVAFSVPVGDYNISVSAEGYKEASSGPVTIGANGLDFTFVLQKIVQNNGSTTPVESELLAGVEMYPNPASVATVLHGVENAKRIAVYTVMGVQVMSQAVHGEKELRVSVEHMAEGVYVVIVQTESGERKALKLVVRR